MKITSKIARLRGTTSGVGMAEYGTLCAIMVLGSLLAIMHFSGKVRSYYEVSADLLANPGLLTPGETIYILGLPPEPDMEAEDPYGHALGKNFLYGTRYGDVLELDGVYDGVFGAGSDDMMVGTSKGEIFIGGPGDDVMIGARGADTYVFTPGSGFDVVDETTGDASVDTLDMREFSLSSLSMSRMKEGEELLIKAGGADEVMLRGYFDPYSDVAHLERLILSDGTFETAQDFRDVVADKQKVSGTVWGTKWLENYRHTVSEDGSYTIFDNHNASSQPMSTLTFTDAAADEVQFFNDFSGSRDDLVMTTADGDTIRILDQNYYLGKRGIVGVQFDGGERTTLDLQGLRSKTADDMKKTGRVEATRYTEDLFHDAGKDGSYRLVNNHANGDPLEMFRILNASPDQVRFRYRETTSVAAYFDLMFDDGAVVDIYMAFRDVSSKNDEGIAGIIFEGDPSTSADDIHLTPDEVMAKAMADGVANGYVRGWRGDETVIYTHDSPASVTYYPGYASGASNSNDILDLTAFDRADATFAKSSRTLIIRLPDSREIRIGDYFLSYTYRVEQIVFGDGAGGTVILTEDDILPMFGY